MPQGFYLLAAGVDVTTGQGGQFHTRTYLHVTEPEPVGSPEEPGVPVAILSVEPTADGLTYPIEVDSCGGDLTVEENDATIKVVVTTTSTSPDDCVDAAEIVLGGPLGSRDLIDGTTGQRLDVPAGGDPAGES